MGYYINIRKTKAGTVYWRLLREEWTNGAKATEHIPTDQLLQHGFSPLMSIDEAKGRVKQLNALTKLDRKAEKLKAAALRSAKARQGVESAHLPPNFVQEFVDVYLRAEMDIGKQGEEKYKKALSHWLYAERLIAELALPQQLWFQHKRRFYSYFSKHSTSPDYAAKILRVLNLWGAFIAIKTGSSFIPVPGPKGTDRHMMKDSYSESDKRKKISAPLTPELLEAARSNLKEAQYRWLFISVWLGLRPSEVDSIKKHSKVDMTGPVPVLSIYQPKLVGVAKEHRYKLIPIIYPEQRIALGYIKDDLVRPIVKTVQKYVAPDVNLYGGRKGFTDLMLSKGQSLEDISAWLGHTTIEMTWRHYKQKRKVNYKKPA